MQSPLPRPNEPPRTPSLAVRGLMVLHEPRFGPWPCSDGTDPRLLELRALHLDLDRAVLAAYGWHDLDVPPFTTPTTPAEEQTLQTFHDQVIDRLFLLNAERAEQERLAGARTASKRKPKRDACAAERHATDQQTQLPLAGGDE